MVESRHPRITVAIPAYNAAGVLGHTLENLLQSMGGRTDCEVLVGDHGSDDGTADVAAGFALRHPAFRRVPIARHGPNRAFARNRLAEEARGDVVVFIDQDILVGSSFVDEHGWAHEAHPGGIVAGYTFGKTFVAAPEADGMESIDPSRVAQAYDRLKAHVRWRDIRSPAGPATSGPNRWVDLRHVPAAFSHFWTCNLSVRRSDFHALGGFDEAYQSWGMEDDDLAYRYQLKGGPMIFSNAAWCCHWPHPVDVRRNTLSWRENREYFFAKFATRELELYALNGGYVKEPSEVVERNLGLIPSRFYAADHLDRLARMLPRSEGTRLGLLMPEPAWGVRLGLSHCLIPFAAMGQGATRVGTTTCYSLLGMKTPWPEQSIDEALLPVEAAALLDANLLRGLLLETARTCRRLTLISGLATCEEERSPSGLAALTSWLRVLRFDEINPIRL